MEGVLDFHSQKEKLGKRRNKTEKNFVRLSEVT
jgi:hypothetical protein